MSQFSEMLWTAPELFEQFDAVQNSRPAPTVDIYSFGILCSEIITKMEAYAINKNEEKLTDDGECFC
jgi:serine/threonine protein kinase